MEPDKWEIELLIAKWELEAHGADPGDWQGGRSPSWREIYLKCAADLRKLYAINK